MTRAQRRYRTCVHEAGHAVAGYCFGAPLSDRGCEAGLDEGVTANTYTELETQQEGVVIEAGGVAEDLWVRETGEWVKSEYEIYYSLLVPVSKGVRTDSQDRMELAVSMMPANPYQAMADWNKAARRLLSDRIVWHAIIHLANELYRGQALEAEEVEEKIMFALNQAKAAGHRVNQTNRQLYKLLTDWELIWRQRAASRYWERREVVEQRIEEFRRQESLCEGNPG